MYAVLELWVQVCGASAGVLQGGASGEALFTHLLSDISPPADTLKVSLTLVPTPGFIDLCLNILPCQTLSSLTCFSVYLCVYFSLSAPQSSGEP